MIERFSEALRLMLRNTWLLAAIILTVWLPGNIVINYVTYGAAGKEPMDVLSIALLVQMLLTPISLGGLIYALFQLKSGQPVTYQEAMSVALRKWPRMVLARLYASILIALGLIALIIPGIILAVRFSLLEEAIIVEDARMSESLRRSNALTTGRRWEIFWSVILFACFYVVFSFVIYLPMAMLQPVFHIDVLNSMPFAIVFDCLDAIAFGVLQIVIFLFFWEARQQGAAAATTPVKHLHA